MRFPVSRADVEEVLVHIHDIAPASRQAFRARMRHLQRNKFPPGINTGKGKPADYDVDQLLLLVIAFQMIQLGLTPEAAISVLSKGGRLILEEVRVVVRSLLEVMKSGLDENSLLHDHISFEDNRIVIFDPHTLRPLEKTPDSPDVFLALSLRELIDLLQKKGLPMRLATLDLLAVVMVIFDAINDLSGEPPAQAFHSWLLEERQ